MFRAAAVFLSRPSQAIVCFFHTSIKLAAAAMTASLPVVAFSVKVLLASLRLRCFKGEKLQEANDVDSESI